MTEFTCLENRLDGHTTCDFVTTTLWHFTGGLMIKDVSGCEGCGVDLQNPGNNCPV